MGRERKLLKSVINIKKILLVIVIFLFCFSKSYAVIEDSIFASVGNKAVTQSDILKEIKIILILNGKSFSEEMRDELESAAIRTTIEMAVKQIEVDKYDFLKVNEADLERELNIRAANIDMDLDTFKSVFIANGIDFSNIVNKIRTELLWNGLVFELYKDRLSINIDEIDEQLKNFKGKKEIKEYLLSEIVIKSVSKENIESKIEEVKNKIKTEGFEKVAINLSISETATKGGDLGWVIESIISEDVKSQIIKTPVGDIAEPIVLPAGILFLKVRDKRTTNKFADLEETKNKLINVEKTKILNMHSLSHYDKLRRSISIKYY